MKNSILGLLMLSVAFLMACGDDDGKVDTTPPSIKIEEPVSGEMFAASTAEAEGEIHFEAVFEDDVALASYSISVHNNFDGHSHGRSDVAVTAFEYNESYEITGKLYDDHQHIEIPAATTAGPYHLVVEAIDAAGNSTSFADGSSKELEIWITNEEMIHVHFEDGEGVEVDEYEVTVGENIAGAFFGEIEDESGTMEHVIISVGHMEEGEEHDHDDHDHARVDEDVIYEEEFELEGLSSTTIESLLAEESIIITQAELDELEEGEHLYLIVQAEDADGNISQYSIELHFD